MHAQSNAHVTKAKTLIVLYLHVQLSTYMYLIRTACHAALCTKVSVKSLLDISTTLYMMVCYISSNHGNVTFVLLETNLPGIGMSHISFLNS